MTKNTVTQAILILASVIGLFSLYFFGRTTPELSLNDAAEIFTSQIESVELNTDALSLKAVNDLTEGEKELWDNVEENEKVAFWQSLDRNDIAAIYSKAKAEKKNGFEQWNLTGDLSIRAFRETQDSLQQLFFIQEAVSSYEKALDYQEDVSTKLKLAQIHTKLTGATMKGVLMLREIVEKEPKNIQANYELGLLSLRSGQNDKAMERFDLLIQEEPKFIEPYILKAQLLISEERKEEASNVLDLAIANTTEEKGLQVLQNMKENIK